MRAGTKVKLCGLTRESDVACANRILPDYIGFVFFNKSSRYVEEETARVLKAAHSEKIQAVGVFVNESPERIAALLNDGVIDAAQLHGDESEEEIIALRKLTDKPLIKAFKIRALEDVKRAEESPADHILLDAGAGEGRTFDWGLLDSVKRDYFLAGGLSLENVEEAVKRLSPYAVDVSSGIETDGKKDEEKMKTFTETVRRMMS